MRENNSAVAQSRVVPSSIKDGGVLLRILVCLAVLITLYFRAFESFVFAWYNSSSFSHGFLVPVISFYLVWKRRDNLADTPVNPVNAGFFLILAGLFVHFVGTIVSENFISGVSLLIVLVGLALFLLSIEHLKLLVFPIAFLFFMIPIPSILLTRITFPMQIFASKISAATLSVIGIPIYREGNIIHLASTSLQVAEACSGIRSLMTLLALGTIFSYLSKRLFWQRAVMIIACVPIALTVNIVRVTGTGILVELFGPSMAKGWLHETAGFMVFFVALLLLFLLSAFLEKISPEPKEGSGGRI